MSEIQLGALGEHIGTKCPSLAKVKTFERPLSSRKSWPDVPISTFSRNENPAFRESDERTVPRERSCNSLLGAPRRDPTVQMLVRANTTEMDLSTVVPF